MRCSCAACYRAFQTTYFVFTLFSFEKGSGDSEGREKGPAFGALLLKLEPAVSRQSQQVVIFVLQSSADTDAG